MQISFIALIINTFIVINSISNVATLLNFGHNYSFTNSMYQAGRYKKHISLFYRNILQQFLNLIVFKSINIFIACAIFRKTNN